MKRVRIAAGPGAAVALIAACTQFGAADGRTQAAGAASLADTAWTVDQLGVEAVPTRRPLSLRFADADRVSGHDGCNTFVGSVVVRGTALEFGEKLAGTMMACPDAVEALARSYRERLHKVSAYRKRGDGLELLDDSGTVLLSLSRVSSSLAGTRWKAVFYHNGKNAVVSVMIGTRINARFGEDRRITGNAGCNSYFARYGVHGQSIKISAPAATRRVCADPTGIMEQEARYLLALPAATQYRFEADRLELRDANGSLVAAFARAPEK